jgi:hypothetical protein
VLFGQLLFLVKRSLPFFQQNVISPHEFITPALGNLQSLTRKVASISDPLICIVKTCSSVWVIATFDPRAQTCDDKILKFCVSDLSSGASLSIFLDQRVQFLYVCSFDFLFSEIEALQNWQQRGSIIYFLQGLWDFQENNLFTLLMYRRPEFDRNGPILVQSCLAVVFSPRNLTLFAGVKSFWVPENLSKGTHGRS